MSLAKLEALRDEWSRRHTPERARRFICGEVNHKDMRLMDAITKELDEVSAKLRRNGLSSAVKQA